jgi:hypothetical protein
MICSNAMQTLAAWQVLSGRFPSIHLQPSKTLPHYDVKPNVEGDMTMMATLSSSGFNPTSNHQYKLGRRLLKVTPLSLSHVSAV